MTVNLAKIAEFFHTEIPRVPSGKYVHFITLRYSKSFPIFRTDDVLNTVRTTAGLQDQTMINHLVMFKRKQTTPERLVGRELLRSLGLTSGTEADKEKYCAYNGEDSCKKCPDCIIYGFAIGDKGSERSKVLSDSAFSLTAYEVSHRLFTFNAPSEQGTMSEGGKMRSSINGQDHVLPEIIFPAIETLRDPTKESFIYVLGNLLRTKRYGAQETRTGVMENHIVGIVVADGEIFSNLHLTQGLYDACETTNNHLPHFSQVKENTQKVVQELLEREAVHTNFCLYGEDLQHVLQEVQGIYKSPQELQQTMQKLYEQTSTYASQYGAFASEKTKKEQGNSKKGRKSKKEQQQELPLEEEE
ncbi:MAG: type I-D CRISPR-associated protein Cas7/Csc2 [Pseudanabaenaceae cyanobacterium SKYGB_i_bin29]|nr:type I-D CRISPR-associated protein Cas7/Csc2 [Pseudanabaenaceae cyanobacterium SKYG29]MDW8420994.1 type I-D CRISPR-associated protein Cas7/Csc2 [Pseudanabaenaceae cyanobacterium SKYGB_i_bin29]